MSSAPGNMQKRHIELLALRATYSSEEVWDSSSWDSSEWTEISEDPEYANTKTFIFGKRENPLNVDCEIYSETSSLESSDLIPESKSPIPPSRPIPIHRE